MLTSFKNILSKMAVIIIIGLTAICFLQKNKINKLDKDLLITTNNYKCYEELNKELKNSGRTL